MDGNKIGARLRSKREALGQTKAFVARKTGISYRSLCAYEYGERVPIDSVKKKLADYYGVTVESIFFTE